MTQPIGVNFDQAVRDAVMQILGDPIAFPEVFKSWVTGWIEANPPTLPITQITGFTQFTPSSATVAAHESTTSTSYTDLATVGPQLANLPDGKYLIVWGAVLSTSGSANAHLGVKVNATAPSDSEAVQIGGASNFGVTNVVLKNLSNKGANTLTVQYRTENATSTLSAESRWMFVIKYGNL